MKKLIVVLLVAAVAVPAMADIFGTGENQFTIDFVPISGNTNPTSGYGIVNNDYRMGTYEITNDQWTKFKAAQNAVTGSPSTAYDSDTYFTGTSVPTNNVSWYEAAQFVNYLNISTNHQAAYKFTGTQGISDYTMAVWDATDAWGGTNLYRHKDAFYFLPTENEWVKAAYWNGTSIQTYTNASAGDIVSGLPDSAKWNYSPSVGHEPWSVTSGIKELNDTYNMMGNVWEWTESPYSIGDYLSGSYRGLRGGAFGYYDNTLASSFRYCYFYPDSEGIDIGFRVASVPEPATMLLFGLGGLIIRTRKK